MTLEMPAAKDAIVQEQGALKAAVESGNWETLTAKAFPVFSSEQARPFYLARYGMINAEIQNLDENPAVAFMDEEGRGILRGRLKELGAAASETIKLLYPNVKPAPQEQALLTLETIETIEDFVEKGAIEQLNEEVIPGWDNLSADQRLLYRLGALQVYYDKWQKAENDDSLDERSPAGFDKKADSPLTQIKHATQIVQDKIVTRHLTEWLDEAKKLRDEEK